MKYSPSQSNPSNLYTLKQYIQDEFRRIANAFKSPESQTLTLATSHSEPRAPEEGMLVYADGTNWNPGSGAGIYQYRSTTWTFIG